MYILLVALLQTNNRIQAVKTRTIIKVHVEGHKWSSTTTPALADLEAQGGAMFHQAETMDPVAEAISGGPALEVHETMQGNSTRGVVILTAC